MDGFGEECLCVESSFPDNGIAGRELSGLNQYCQEYHRGVEEGGKEMCLFLTQRSWIWVPCVHLGLVERVLDVPISSAQEVVPEIGFGMGMGTV
jgi:hypothetical protein